MKYLILLLFFAFVHQDHLVPFCSFKQLSQHPPKTIGTKLLVRPRLLCTRYAGILPEIDSYLYYKTWVLEDKKFFIRHFSPSSDLKMYAGRGNDTLQILNTKFNLQMIIPDVIPCIEQIWHYEFSSHDYLFFKVLDDRNGSVYHCYLIAFEMKHDTVICLNQIAGISGEAMLVDDNLITDLNNDGYPEFNLLDSAGNIVPYIVQGSGMVKSEKKLAVRQKENRFYMEAGQSAWYFPLISNKDVCAFSDGKPFLFDYEDDEKYLYK